MSEFHIHVDATWLAQPFESYLTHQLRFWRTDFIGHPEGEESFEPIHHLTFKTTRGEEFRRIFDDVVEFAKRGPQIVGYVEGELVAIDRDIAGMPYDPRIEIPFSVNCADVRPGEFRESEIHVALSRDRSDPRLVKSLQQMGFFSAYLAKAYGVAQIFTLQGSGQTIQELLAATVTYLNSAGGAIHCSIKEERIAKWWVSEQVTQLPPVVKTVRWTKHADALPDREPQKL